MQTMENKTFFKKNPRRKIQGQKNKGERGGKKDNLLFLETCHWTDIVSPKVMYDGSKPFYPLLKNTKIQKHQIRKTEEGKSRKLCLGGSLFVLAAVDNVNNLS